ncbi:MAG: FMN-binding protein [Treponema sp.]|jgi:uncharacterized protein with FMN-binding domain|nr:FMN-binding protein [Treponema sp.]
MKGLYWPPFRVRKPSGPAAGIVSGAILAALALLFSGCASGGLKSGGAARFLRENFFPPQSGGVSPANCRDGVWEGLGRGYRGNILLRLTVAGGFIRDIEIVEHREDPAVGGEAMTELLEQVLARGPAETDVVSGATESSRGFLNALEDALRQGAR